MPKHDVQLGSHFDRAVAPEDRLAARHIVLSAGLHAAVFLALLLLPGSVPPAPEPIVVELIEDQSGAAGTAGGGRGDKPAAPSAEATPPAAAAPKPKPREQPVLPKAREQPVAPKAREQPVAKAKPRPPPAPVAEAPPEPAPQPVEAPAPAPPAEQAAAAPGAPPPGTGDSGPGGPKGAGQGNTGAGPGIAGAGAGPGDDYFDRLRRWLAKYKRYPPEAVKQKQQGTVMVAFVVARDGTVLDAEIERSSGHPLIDRAVIEMLHNASPVPPLPDHFKGERARIAMPIDFKLGFFSRHF